jgi:hypothetical protein
MEHMELILKEILDKMNIRNVKLVLLILYRFQERDIVTAVMDLRIPWKREIS